uniref:Uncharacterized protein n=1 Tax=Ananas comosus var. bracteatus TaxID=296719 RepID=A0A6V7Q7K1_ANACO|nr:unnamed protein product [Ananas comosus var. bracteatus]
MDQVTEEEEYNEMGSPVTSTLEPRHHLLFSYASSILAIADTTYRRVEEMHGPIGSLAKRVASTTRPMLHPLLLQCLSILSFFDSVVVKFENITMSIFPPSTIIFAKIDELALLADSFPKFFNDAVDELLVFLHRLPVIDVAMEKLGMMSSPSSDERDIIVDIKCEEGERREEDCKREGEGIREVEKSRKEIIEVLEIVEVAEDQSQRGSGRGGDSGGGRKGVVKDQILELFDEGWHLRSV